MTAIKHICLVAGETSGDILGGHLAKELKNMAPHYRITGVGSTQMKNAGVEILIDSTQLAVMGVAEIILKFNTIRRCFKKLLHFFKTQPPDLLILIDYPGFNLRLAAKAKALGIKVMYYVSPQIWAWHYSRIKKIKRSVDKMAVLFPFEKKIYQKEGVPVEFVGHPLVQAIRPSLSKEIAYQRFNLDPGRLTIGLLPGSRQQEIDRLLPIMLACVKLIKNKLPNVQFLLPLAPHLTEDSLKNYDLQGITLVHNNTYNAIQLCQMAIVTSGTVTLEVGLLQVPMIIIYKVHAISALIGRFIGEIRKFATGEKCFGLCNIVAEEPLMPEFLQDAAKPEAISAALLEIITCPEKMYFLKQKLSLLNEKLQSENAASKAAQAAMTLIESDGAPI